MKAGAIGPLILFCLVLVGPALGSSDSSDEAPLLAVLIYGLVIFAAAIVLCGPTLTCLRATFPKLFGFCEGRVVNETTWPPVELSIVDPIAKKFLQQFAPKHVDPPAHCNGSASRSK
jgi:hypothetical protein